MPKILSYTPAWLSRPSSGFHLFSNSIVNKQENGGRRNGSRDSKNSTCVGPKRIIARRGTEVFVVVDDQIRWSDLGMLKDKWDEQQILNKRKGNSLIDYDESGDGIVERNYRVLKPPRNEQIQQLSISPNGFLLAILTLHTVHVAIVPDSSHLDQEEDKPLKLKAWTVGPTTHVLSQSPVICALWHPCGVAGKCLVTITADAVVRIWELDTMNRWSFDSPSLAVDLKKLAQGTSDEDDFEPCRIGRNRGFSSDMAGMEVASACFGGTGSGEESSWSAMTLWIVMKDGDVYALCPLLPAQWQTSTTSIPFLSAAIVSKEVTSENKTTQRDQYQWMSDLDSQEPKKVLGNIEFAPLIEIYNRPATPGPIPRLQGPFQIYPDDSEENMELSDIHVIAGKFDNEELMLGEDSDSESDISDEGGLSASVVCLMTKSGRVHLCLELDGVEGEWLPRKKSSETLPYNDRSLVPIEVLDTLKSSRLDDEWPTFTFDIKSRYSFFVTHSQGVYFFSLEPWLPGFENEFQNDSIAGTSFRLNVLKGGVGTLRERILQFGPNSGKDSATAATACVVFQDSNIGYFLLTSVDGHPQAALFDQPEQELPGSSMFDDEYVSQPRCDIFPLGPPRSIYQPPNSLWAHSSLTYLVDRNVPIHQRKAMKDEIRLSAATLALVTESHRILSEETYQLGMAVADLFRRCERLQDELHEQIKTANEAAGKIEGIVNGISDDYEEDEPQNGNMYIEKRLYNAINKQEELMHRYEDLRRKVARLGGKQLNAKEKRWMSEVEKIGDSSLEPETKEGDNDEDNDEDRPLKPWQRYNEIRQLSRELLPRAAHIKEERSRGKEKDSHKNEPNIPPDIRKAKVEHAQVLLEKETTLLNATMARFKRLSTLPSIS